MKMKNQKKIMIMSKAKRNITRKKIDIILKTTIILMAHINLNSILSPIEDMKSMIGIIRARIPLNTMITMKIKGTMITTEIKTKIIRNIKKKNLMNLQKNHILKAKPNLMGQNTIMSQKSRIRMISLLL